MQVDHTKTIIEIKNVSFSYNGEPVLEDINLNIHKGDYLGIIGPNGGGKTTLLKIMLGLLKPTKGSVLFFGCDVYCFKEWSRVGYVSQKAVQFDSNFPATVYEVVRMGRIAKRGLLHTFNKQDDEIVETALKQVEMWEYKDSLIGDLSGGQQQRAFIARALANEPEVILLDEPTVGVDVKTQEQFYNLLKKLNKELHITLILVSHDIDVVAHEVTEIACINKTLVYDNNPKEFLKHEGLEKLYGDQVTFILHNH